MASETRALGPHQRGVVTSPAVHTGVSREFRRVLFMEVEPTHIVILGAGFGGLYTALRLEQLLPRDGSVEVTLVNRDNFFLFTPMLHGAASDSSDKCHQRHRHVSPR